MSSQTIASHEVYELVQLMQTYMSERVSYLSNNIYRNTILIYQTVSDEMVLNINT